MEGAKREKDNEKGGEADELDLFSSCSVGESSRELNTPFLSEFISYSLTRLGC